MAYSHPKLQPHPGIRKSWILLEDYYYSYTYKGKTYCDIAPAGFISDGSSLPLGWMYQKHDPDSACGFIPHDHAFATGRIPQKIIDMLYRDRLIDQKIGKYRVKIAYRTLRMVGFRAYNKHKMERLNDPIGHSKRHGLPLPKTVVKRGLSKEAPRPW